MSLEDLLAKATAAMTRLADVIEKNGGVGGGAPAAGGKAPAAGKGGKAPAAPKYTAEQVSEIIMRVKDEISPDKAKEIIGKHAGAGKKLADLTQLPAKFDAAYADAEAALNEAGAGGDEGGDDGI